MRENNPMRLTAEDFLIMVLTEKRNIPMALNLNGEYVIDIVQYQRMQRKYEPPKGFLRIHTVGSVAEEILQERAKRNGYYAQ